MNKFYGDGRYDKKLKQLHFFDDGKMNGVYQFQQPSLVPTKDRLENQKPIKIDQNKNLISQSKQQEDKTIKQQTVKHWEKLKQQKLHPRKAQDREIHFSGYILEEIPYLNEQWQKRMKFFAPKPQLTFEEIVDHKLKKMHDEATKGFDENQEISLKQKMKQFMENAKKKEHIITNIEKDINYVRKKLDDFHAWDKSQQEDRFNNEKNFRTYVQMVRNNKIPWADNFY